MPYVTKIQRNTWEEWSESNWEDLNVYNWEDIPEYKETIIKPLDVRGKGAELITELSYSSRINGGEDITFKAFNHTDSDFQIGGIYKVYSDRQLNNRLPCTFILQSKDLIKQGSHDTNEFIYQCKAVGVQDLLYRVWMNVKYKSIGFKDAMERMLAFTRKKLPIISEDISGIEDYDYTFTILEYTNRYLGEIFEEIRPLGFSIYLDPDLRLVAKHQATSPINEVDFYSSKIDTETVVLSSAQVANQYKQSPTTSLVVQGSNAEESDFLSTNVVTNENPTIDLNHDVLFENQFILQSFDDAIPQGYTKQDQTGTGWDKRYLIYDEIIQPVNYLSVETKFQLINKVGMSYVVGYNNGSAISLENNFCAFYVDNQSLKIIANQITYDPSISLKAFELKTVSTISADRKTLTVLEDISNLNVGDIVNVAGNESTANATNAIITALNVASKQITIDTTITEGVLSGLTLSRFENYVVRWVIQGSNTKFFFKRENEQFQEIGEYQIIYPDQGFITLFNNYNGKTLEVDNGVWEVGNLALDYTFMDLAEFIRMSTPEDNKVYLCTTDQFEVLADNQAVVNRINKNGIDYAQVEFISPAYIRTVLQEGTSTRIYIPLQEEDFIKQGMNCLIKESGETVEITAYFKDVSSGYIDVTPAMTSIPAIGDEIYINTSIPAIGSSYQIDYTPALPMVVREQASDECLARFRFRERAINLPEFESYADIAERALALVEIECTPSVSGSYGYIMNGLVCTDKNNRVKSFGEVPVPGSYITCSDSEQSITSELAEVQSITIAQIPGTNYYNIGIDFGIEKEQLLEKTQSLIKQFGILRDPSSEDITFNIPPTFRETIYYNDESLTLTQTTAYDFLSGLYVSNLSGLRT